MVTDDVSEHFGVSEHFRVLEQDRISKQDDVPKEDGGCSGKTVAPTRPPPVQYVTYNLDDEKDANSGYTFTCAQDRKSTCNFSCPSIF